MPEIRGKPRQATQWQTDWSDRECIRPELRSPRPPSPTPPRRTDPVMQPVGCLLAAPPMTDDRPLLAHRTPAWHLRQADPSYPGSLLSSVDVSAIKRMTAGVKTCRWSSRQVQSSDRAFTLPHKPVSDGKRTMVSASPDTSLYSCRSTIIGSVRAALRAGIQALSPPIVASAATVKTSVVGSAGVSP
jgi:hypothetical protein